MGPCLQWGRAWYAPFKGAYPRPSLETIRRSMSHKVQVEPEPGLGLGLRITKDLHRHEYVGLVLGASLYSKHQLQELIDKGHTDARHAMETPSGMIIDATEAIGVFAANEPNNGDPNLMHRSIPP